MTAPVTVLLARFKFHLGQILVLESFILYTCYRNIDLLQVMRMSSVTRQGIPEVWQMMEEFNFLMTESNEIFHKRENQLKIWMWNYIKDHIMDSFREHSNIKNKIPDMEQQVVQGLITPGLAADLLLHDFMKDS